MPELMYEDEFPEKPKGERGRVKAHVIGDNGEEQVKTEWYDNESNADRGLAEILRSLLELAAKGEIDLRRAT